MTGNGDEKRRAQVLSSNCMTAAYFMADCAVGVHRDWQDESMYQERLLRAEADAQRSLLVLEVCFFSNKYYMTSTYKPCDAKENFAVASSPSLDSYDLHRGTYGA